ncbi:MAG: site-specific DNA-methyltransferase [Chromatiaceae bacterium]|nr:site-specific DNA-methyltransferase [Chromatiaceae bacterium]
MNPKYEKLKNLLKELFQLDRPDLDFGLYRVMHAKSSEVTQFLDKDLLPQVQAAFGQYQTADKAELEKALAKVMAGIEAAGMDPAQSPKVADLRAQIKNEAVDRSGLEGEVYDHLYSFFRRYYSEGDFLAKRVYKAGVYAIPYEGEEVTLHWANKDQYYIKTSEYLRDYAFRLRPEDDQRPLRVHFRLVEAAEGEHGNVKAAADKDRVFILAAPGATGRDFVTEEAGEQGQELVIGFEYRPATLTDWPAAERNGKKKPPAQKDLIALSVKGVLALTDPALAAWTLELGRLYDKSGGEKADYSRLEAHLRRYTARNTFDYFIHKDLGTFLRRELDFYIKNEVMHLDDVENETAPRVEQYLSKIKVLRRIGGKIIDFLAQLEDFQKKLWLKKKFVVETQWCITVASIPEAFYPEIAANGAQREEWIAYLAVDEIAGDAVTRGYSVPLTTDFLAANPTLVVDTRHFDTAFTERLLEAMGDMDKQVDGLLIYSENFQAIRLVKQSFNKKITCIHIDPPYNTETSGFLYKNNYQHSSWLTMMWDRLIYGTVLLNEEGHLLCHIDENEYERLKNVSEALGLNDAGTVVWDKRNPMTGGSGIALQHEYIIWLMNSSKTIYQRNVNFVEMLKAAESIIAKSGGVNEKARSEYSAWVRDNNALSGGEKAYAYLDYNGKIYQSVSLRAPEPRTDPKFFQPLMHPRTGLPCSVPPNGFSRTPETLESMIARDEILFGANETIQPRQKKILTNESQMQVKSVIQDAKTGKAYLDQLGLAFPYCHPVSLYKDLLGATNKTNSYILDYFAGSGTSGHAAIELNRFDGVNRKFILAENGDHFDTVLLPRIKKVTFTPEWKDGKPKRPATPEEAERGPRIVKVIRLESYEDTLNNLETRRTQGQQSLLDHPDAQGPDGLREQYLLRYLLDVETRGSQSLLNVAAFADPTAYQLKVKRPGTDESRLVKIDRLETFNWLIGLTVRHIAAPRTYGAAFDRDSEKRLRLQGRLRELDAAPSPQPPPAGGEGGKHWWFRTVTGATPDGRKTLIIWRKLTGDAERDNLVLDEWFKKQGYSSQDSEFDLIYVNGGNNLENLKAPDDLWKVRLIEEDFYRLMFATEGV